MTREIITVAAGQCGVRVADSIYTMLSQEHGIDGEGRFVGGQEYMRQYASAVFTEGRNGEIYTPLCVMADLDTNCLNDVRAGPRGRLYDPDTLISSNGNKDRYGGSRGCYSSGHYTEGAEIVNSIMDVIRIKAEACDCLAGFVFPMALEGGTGSGLGSLLADKIRREFSDRALTPFLVLPNITSSSNSQASYNYMLGSHSMQHASDMSLNFSNESLMNLRRDGSEVPDLKSLNTILASVFSDFTSDHRFPGMKHVSIRKMMVNLVPYSRLNKLTVSRVGIVRGDPQTAETLVPRLFSNANLMTPIDLRKGKFLTSQVLFRGAVSHSLMEEQLTTLEKRNPSYFNTVATNSTSSQQIDVPLLGEQTSGLLLANHTGITHLLRRYSENFTRMFRRKAFLHWYTGDGMDEMEFTEAESTISDLISEYEQYEGSGLMPAEEDQDVEE